jgi:glycosyltransferase involved in cell wall biosynthesis
MSSPIIGRMRVLVGAAWPARPLTDGASLILHHHVRVLAARHELLLVVPDGPGAADVDCDVIAARPGLAAGGGGPWVRRRLTTPPGTPLHVRWLEDTGVPAAVREAAPAFRPDVVHLHGWGTAVLAGTGAVPAVHHAIDAWSLNLANRDVPVWRRPFEVDQPAAVRRHERTWYPRCRSTLVVGEADADHLRTIAPGLRVDVVPNGVEAGAEPVPPPAAPVVGFHGTYDSRANSDAARRLAALAPAIRQAGAGAGIELVGRASAHIAEIAAPGVTIVGEVADVRPWLDRVAVYAAPMVSGSGIKNKILEAMAAGRPVVTSPLGANGIGAGEGVVVVDGDAAFAAAVVALLRDPDRRAAAGRANRERVLRDFTWERSAARVEAVWQDVTA